jgi:transcription termination factor Rho
MEACVSVDAHELERAALRKKDREQLQAIARAMGGSPSSRARKDQIIDLIMGLAGEPAVASGAAGGAVPPARPPAPPAESPTESPTASETATPLPLPVGGGDVANGSGNGHDRQPNRSQPAESPAGDTTLTISGDAGGDASTTPAGSDTPTWRPASFELDEPSERAALDQRGNGRQPSDEPARFVFAPDDPGPGLDDDLDDEGGQPGAERFGRRQASGSGEPRDDRGRDVRPVRPVVSGERGDGEQPAEREFRPPAGRDDNGHGDSDVEGGLAGRSLDGDGPGEVAGRRRRRRGKDRNRDERVERLERTDRPERDERQGPGPRPAGEDLAGQESVPAAGYLDLREEGYGFLRVRGVLPSKDDVYVPSKFVRQFSLRKGDRLEGSSRPAGRGEKNPALLRIDAVNGQDPERARTRPRFEDLTPLFPDEKLRLERADDPSNMTARIVDLIAPIGKGQRGLIVSPPKAGKTTIMKQVAQSIEANNPEVRLIVLLVDERPEEVTDMRRSVKGEVVASTFDRPSDEHTAVAELTIERAKRMVEMGEDVVIILDGITRLARAYNLAAPATGRIMSGGIDTGALYPPKKFFGAARNVEEGGSLTILATALVETGSRMDEVIFEEFKGTGNMELRLDRRMAEKRIYPAIDVDASSTRHEELLFERRQLQMVWKLRRVLSGLAESNGGLELLVDRMKTFRSNDEFLAEVAKAPSM